MGALDNAIEVIFALFIVIILIWAFSSALISISPLLTLLFVVLAIIVLVGILRGGVGRR
jgi:uncharacterized membrane protein YdfJ with MMPL/SSD domain